MAAPNLTTLFDFEGQFEQAAQAILTATGIAAYISQEAQKLPGLFTGISFDVNPALDVLEPIPKPSNWPEGQAAPQEYFRYTGNLEYFAEVRRDANTASVSGVDTMMSQLRGQLRAAMMRCVMPFTNTNLPYYRVTDIRPNGTTTGFNQGENVDFCSVRFVVTFQIQPEAWPAWVES